MIMIKYLDLFSKHLTLKDLSDRTVKNYLGDIAYFYKWLINLYDKEKDITLINQGDIKAYRQELLVIKRQKATSVNRRLQSLKNFFKYLHALSYIKNDPSKNIKFAKKIKMAKPQSLNRKEVHLILNAAKESKHGLACRNYALVQLMLQTGLRVSEVCRLQMRDIKINERSGFLRVIDSKGIKEREIPINSSARVALREYFQERSEYKENTPVFISKRGDAVNIRSLQLAIYTICKRAGIDRINCSSHTFRHTFASNYLKANPNQLTELASLMGHDSVNTTAIYTKPSKSDLEISVEKTETNIYG